MRLCATHKRLGTSVLCLMFICNLHIVCVCVCASGETAALFISVSVCIHSFMCSYNKKKKRWAMMQEGGGECSYFGMCI